MIKRRLFLSASFALLASVHAYGADPVKAGVGEVRLREGRELLRDCVPWIPRGLSFFGRVIPKGWQSDPSTMAAQESFGDWNIDAVKQFGGDVLRLQVGLPFVDPQSPQYKRGYLAEIQSAVAGARSAGLTVIVSLQYEGRTNVKPVEWVPKDSARGAWRVLGPAFSDDEGVIYELFNEPASAKRPSAKQWEAWRSGHQAIIDDLRRASIRNLLIVDGLNGSHTFEGAPALKDPIKQTMYGVHPYLREDYSTAEHWDVAFGNFAKTHPVMVTEWGHAKGRCKVGGEEVVQQLLAYLEERRIGVIAYGADERSGMLMRRTDKGIQYSSYAGRACDAPGAGPGELLKGFFERDGKRNTVAVPVQGCTHR